MSVCSPFDQLLLLKNRSQNVETFVYLVLAGSTNTVSSRKLKKKTLIFVAASLILASRISLFLISTISYIYFSKYEFLK